ncbi:hypothetical protein ACNQR7_32460 [Mycolicibacterium senegalense]|uniref:hypothetical protein n=1 Tax=Mycolicibacterium senegalense TaxID=1796 RepID=UPI003AAD2D2E
MNDVIPFRRRPGIGLIDSDPVGARFDMYAVPVPQGNWHYILDDWKVTYRRNGWPFTRMNQSLVSGTFPTPEDAPPMSVRVSPDTQHQDWRNEYVLLSPGRRGSTSDYPDGQWAHANLSLRVRSQGLGAILVTVAIELDIANNTAHVPVTCPPVVQEQAQAKAQRLLEFILDHQRKAAATNPQPPITAQMIHRGTDGGGPTAS